jgi:hypothetical protein
MPIVRSPDRFYLPTESLNVYTDLQRSLRPADPTC